MNFFKLLNKFKKPLISIGVILIIITLFNRLLFADAIYESDDYKHHALRTASYYLAVKQGQFPVRWGPNLNQGYGYPSFNYMYHTPYMFGTILHSLNFTIQESLNLSVLFTLLLGAVGCYFFVKSYLKSESWSVLLALSFILNPYTLLNVYWRGAIGELFFYAFVPFFLLGIKKLLVKNKNYYYFLLTSLTFALLILSHLPSVILLFPLTIVLIISELGKQIKLKKLLPSIFAVITGLLLSSWYWVPAYFEQSMITYQNGSSLTEYLDQFLLPLSTFDIRKDFFSSDYFLNVLNIGGVSFLSLFISFYLLKFSKKTFLWLVLFFSSVFLSSIYSQFLWDKIKFLKYIQYPWRFLWLITIISIIFLIYFALEKGIEKKWKKFVKVLVALGILFSSQAYIQNKGTNNRSDFDWYHPTFETGSSFDEHQPIDSKIPYYFPEELMYVNATESALLTIDNLSTYVHELSELNPKILRFDGTSISYEINPNQDIIALQKRLFYPGWEARLDGKKSEFIKNIPQYKGALALKIPKGEKLVSIDFTGYTKLRKVSEYTSVLTLLILVGSVMIIKYHDKKN